MWITLVLKTSESEKYIWCDVLVNLSRSATVWLKISLRAAAAEAKSDSTRGSIKTHRFSGADLRLIPARIIPASRAGVCTEREREEYSHTVPVETDSSKSNLCKFVSGEKDFRVGVPQINRRCLFVLISLSHTGAFLCMRAAQSGTRGPNLAHHKVQICPPDVSRENNIYLKVQYVMIFYLKKLENECGAPWWRYIYWS